MRTTNTFFRAAFLTALCLLCSADPALADVITAQSSATMSTSGTESSSEASFSGSDGRHVVNGDVIEVKRGRLTINGVSYGTVTPESTIRYRVRGAKKILTVDGKVWPLHK